MAIKFENVSYVYSPGSPLEAIGLDQLNFSLEEGKFIALVGHTGSGKSTLMQHFNALLKPTSGKIEIAGYTITPETGNKGLKDLRRKVSLAFQFPEAQLFENTVLKDVEYGPRNFGFSEDEAREAALKWLKKVGLKDDLIEHSPFDLSGGQMRRVALAGVLAYEPEIICLDEPAAGLDPMGRLEMMQLFKDYQAAGHTVILVTHNMDDVADYADDVLVLEHGRLIKHASPKEVFKDSEWLQKHHLAEPRSARFAAKLEAAGLKLPGQPLTMPELADAIKQSLKGESMSKIIIGRYLPGTTFVYRVDPRAKLLTTFYFIIMIFLANNWVSYLVISIFGLACVFATGLKARVFWDGVKPMIWLIVFTSLLQTFFMAGGKVYWHWWIFTLSSEGLINGLYVFIRFAMIILVSTVMTVTTKPLEIADAMEWMLTPLKLFKVNVGMISLVISIALRFVPTLFDQTVKIMNAQRSRGADFNDGGLVKRAKSVVPMLVPLFIDSLEVALDLSTAMESRGYKGSEGRTRYRILEWSKVDLIPAVYCLLLTILMITTRMH